MADSSVKAKKLKGKTTAAFVGKQLKKSWPLYILLLPAIIYTVVFSYVPMYGVQIAFKNFRPSLGINGSEWLDPLFKNFTRFFTYPDFWKMIKKSIQMVTYATHFLSEVVVCSLVIMMLDRANGPINNLIALLGGERFPFMTEAKAFPSIYVWSGVWQNLGWNSILYISALASISPEIVDAAKVDGASRLQIIRHVNIPGIMPTIAITFIMSVGGLLSVGYSKIYLLQNDLNISASQVISTYVYEIGILGGQYAYSTAIGLFNNVVNIICLLIANAVVKKLTDTGLF